MPILDVDPFVYFPTLKRLENRNPRECSGRTAEDEISPAPIVRRQGTDPLIKHDWRTAFIVWIPGHTSYYEDSDKHSAAAAAEMTSNRLWIQFDGTI